MSEWKVEQLGTILEVKYGKDHKALQEGNNPCIGSGGIMRYVNEFLYDKESILIPRKGSLNNIMYQNSPFWTVDTMFWTKINEAKAYPKFLFYQLTLIDYTNLNVGSAVPSLTVPVINEIDVNLPSLNEQKSIAGVLSSLDDKIDLLHRQNKTLEQMVETQFRQWFIEEAKEDWKDGKLSDFGIVVTGKTPSKNNPEYWGGEFYFITPTDFKDFGMYTNEPQRYLSELGWNSMNTLQLPQNSILVTCIGSDMGKVAISSQSCITNQQLNSIIIEEHKYLGFVYQYIKSQYQLLRNIAFGGTTMPIINKTDFSNISIPIPPDKLIEYYQEQWEALSSKIYKNQKQIYTLKNMRDTLLPKLMSGEVTVKIN